jgi:hypothetical protein
MFQMERRSFHFEIIGGISASTTERAGAGPALASLGDDWRPYGDRGSHSQEGGE